VNDAAKPNAVKQFATQPKVLAGGLGASLTTNVIIVVQEFIPSWEPSTAFVGAAAAIVGMAVAWIKSN
jgi:hypothetical protein